MQFGLSESQQILKNNARKFFAAECPIGEVRRLMETETCYDEPLWKKMAEQGFMSVIYPESYGGLGSGNVELALLLEEMGRALLPGPYLSTVAAGAVVDACGTADQKQRYLAPLCQGDVRAAVAFMDGAKMSAKGGFLDGEKRFVADAAVADWIVVSVDSELFVVHSGLPGLQIEDMHGIDLTRKIYSVKFSHTPAFALGHPGEIGRAVDVITNAISAELVGGMQRVLDISVEYAKTRKQFGKPIGQFQAVQHQLADSYLETESGRSAVYYAALALDDRTHDATTAVSIAKMYTSDAARNVGNRGIQVQGGMGFTWENDAHLYYRRFKSDETAFGDAIHHRELIARLVIDRTAVATA